RSIEPNRPSLERTLVDVGNGSIASSSVFFGRNGQGNTVAAFRFQRSAAGMANEATIGGAIPERGGPICLRAPGSALVRFHFEIGRPGCGSEQAIQPRWSIRHSFDDTAEASW